MIFVGLCGRFAGCLELDLFRENRGRVELRFTILIQA